MGHRQELDLSLAQQWNQPAPPEAVAPGVEVEREELGCLCGGFPWPLREFPSANVGELIIQLGDNEVVVELTAAVLCLLELPQVAPKKDSSASAGICFKGGNDTNTSCPALP